MSPAPYRFAGFELDLADRRLWRDGAPVELNARYLDALALMLAEPGRLVTKDRFMGEVWRGVPVTDEALTQCIKTLRRQLGDDAAAPRFIETVPKHGYRFIAPLDGAVPAVPVHAAPGRHSWRDMLQFGGAGTVGGALAGLIGGTIYGLAAATLAPAGIGALSVLLVMVVVTMAVGLIGGAGVGFGVALAGFADSDRYPWAAAGGALGGMLVGALVKLIGLDGFVLLVGRSPGDITGAAEGLAIGAAVGFGAWLGLRRSSGLSLRQAVAAAALTTGTAGATIVLSGGRLLLGSLDQLLRRFPQSRLRVDDFAALFGQDALGIVSGAALAALEGALFGGCVVAAMIAVRRGYLLAPPAAAQPTGRLD